jgi:hypothetical protein
MSQNWRGNDWTASNWDGNNWLGPNEEAPPGSVFANLQGSGSLSGTISVTPVPPPEPPTPQPTGGNSGRKYQTHVSSDSGPDSRDKALKQDEEEVMYLVSYALQCIFDEETMWEA